MDKHDQFLLNLYNQLWNSITQVEEGLWQFVGIYAGILGVHWAPGEATTSACRLAYHAYVILENQYHCECRKVV